jgi:1,4-dihydroxy-2-naphthoate octaprenyltransferase
VTTDQPTAKMPPLWVVKLRAPFFTAAIVPVCLGTAIAWATVGAFNLWYFLLTLVGAICLHAGTNMTNDYFDHTWGSDDINTEFANPFTGGSRLIQMGMVRPRVFLWQGIGFFVIGSLIGLVLLLTRGPWVLWIGLIGVFSGYFYTAPPFRLVRTGLGEPLIGLNFGPLMVLGSYYTQTQMVSWEPVIASLPVAVLITLVVCQGGQGPLGRAAGSGTVRHRLRITASDGLSVAVGGRHVGHRHTFRPAGSSDAAHSR